MKLLCYGILHDVWLLATSSCLLTTSSHLLTASSRLLKTSSRLLNTSSPPHFRVLSPKVSFTRKCHTYICVNNVPSTVSGRSVAALPFGSLLVAFGTCPKHLKHVATPSHTLLWWTMIRWCAPIQSYLFLMPIPHFLPVGHVFLVWHSMKLWADPFNKHLSMVTW